MSTHPFVEVERRFLCRAEGPLLEAADARISMLQGYLSGGRVSVRVRREGDAWRLTCKRGSGRVREEVEVPLPADAGEALLRMAGDVRVEKTRYRVGRWEVDVYGGALEGIVVAECELFSADEPLPPAPEGLHLLREVTDHLTAHALARVSPARAHLKVRRLLEDAGGGDSA
ncbi:MAG TPA: hypothetical protein VMK65_09390 [Longimicrobiales bacterium]|nr:hypothetical protein [Longimicrobiales bacterium]